MKPLTTRCRHQRTIGPWSADGKHTTATICQTRPSSCSL